jgi:hypothetical protein
VLKIGQNGKTEVVGKRTLPKNLTEPFYLSESETVVAVAADADGNPSIVAVDKSGQTVAHKIGFEGEARTFGGDGRLWAAAPLGGPLLPFPTSIELFEWHNGKFSHLSSTEMEQFVGKGYVLDFSFLNKGKRTLMSMGSMDTPEGDPVFVFEVVEGGLKPLQLLQAGFRPGALVFQPTGDVACLQDNNGDIYSFASKPEGWVTAGMVRLQIARENMVASQDGRWLFTTNSDYDILCVEVSTDGTMQELFGFPQLRSKTHSQVDLLVALD